MGTEIQEFDGPNTNVQRRIEQLIRERDEFQRRWNGAKDSCGKHVKRIYALKGLLREYLTKGWTKGWEQRAQEASDGK